MLFLSILLIAAAAHFAKASPAATAAPLLVQSVAWRDTIILNPAQFIGANIVVVVGRRDVENLGASTLMSMVRDDVIAMQYVVLADAFKKLGYHIKLNVMSVVITDEPLFGTHNLSFCERFNFGDGVIIMIASSQTSPGGRWTERGVSNCDNCFAYHIWSPHRKYVSVHEFLHTLFATGHPAEGLGACDKKLDKGHNLLAHWYNRSDFDTFKRENLTLGPECDVPRNYTKTRAQGPPPCSTEMRTWCTELARDDLLEEYIRNNSGRILGDTVDVAHLNWRAKPVPHLARWTRRTTSREGSAFIVEVRERQCPVSKNLYHACSGHSAEYFVRVNPHFDANRTHTLPRNWMDRPSLLTENKCSYYLGTHHFRMYDGTACDFQGVDGACILGVCVLMDQIQPVVSKVQHDPSIWQWVEIRNAHQLQELLGRSLVTECFDSANGTLITGVDKCRAHVRSVSHLVYAKACSEFVVRGCILSAKNSTTQPALRLNDFTCRRYS